MDKKVYLNILYDFYKELLTDKQQNYFEDYYCNDLSLSEIAENENVSRNAVHGQLKIIVERLEEFESVLKLYEKKEKIVKLIKSEVNEKTLDKVLEII